MYGGNALILQICQGIDVQVVRTGKDDAAEMGGIDTG